MSQESKLLTTASKSIKSIRYNGDVDIDELEEIPIKTTTTIYPIEFIATDLRTQRSQMNG